jgi:protein-tyrosine phosphatase
MAIACDPYWITPTLAIVPRPVGGESLGAEMAAMRAAGIDIVVSMLEPAEARELGLEWEEAAARKSGIRFVSFPIPDHGTPAETEPFERILEFLERSMLEGKRVGVHCRGCIGRSSVIAASLLVRSGMKDVDAWRQIREARGTSVPETPQQRAWVETEIRPKAWHRI